MFDTGDIFVIWTSYKAADKMQNPSSSNILSTILRHDTKVTSYKIALLRAINDVVLSFPTLAQSHETMLVPLRVLAEFWVAYYWPFVKSDNPIWQGPRSHRRSGIANDMSFRPDLTHVRETWEKELGIISLPSDGYVLMNEMRIPRKRVQFSRELQGTYEQAIKTISKTIEYPIRYAGPGQWTVFDKPTLYDPAGPHKKVPGTRKKEKCLLIPKDIWRLFCDLSLWIEALCIHEWSLFIENVDQSGTKSKDRGDVYRLLTDRPDNRRPLTWERNQIDILIMEGHEFTCPWTQKHIRTNIQYDVDHLVPVSVYPINEMWNLVPTDPYFNQHRKRNKLPTSTRLQKARPILASTYSTYILTETLANALLEDARIRFSGVSRWTNGFADELASATVAFIRQVANSRNIARF